MSKSGQKPRKSGARFTEQSVHEILEFFPGLACCYRDYRILTMNSSGADLLGYPDRAELEGRLFDDLLAPEYAGMSLIEQILEDGMPCLAMLRQADGSRLRVEIKLQSARELGAGTLIVRAEDVSHRISLATDIHGSEYRFRALVDNAMDLICSCSAGKITFVNRSGLVLIGAKEPADVIGHPLTSLFHRDYHQVFTDPDALRELLDDDALFPARFARHDGTFIDVQISLTPAHEGESFMLEARDITAHRTAVMALHHMNQELDQRVRTRTQELTDEITRREETEEQLRQAALHDGLTGLPNRKLLMERLEHAIHRAHRDRNKVAVIFIDLDGFKNVNDTQGHDAGDTVLKDISSQLLNQVRETDTVARLGGDEFIIAYTDIQAPEEATLLSQRILDAFKELQHMSAGKETYISASIGIALYPDHGDDAANLIMVADESMYDVKKRGKNGFVLAPPKD